ncbi:MAG: ATP-dependent DNA helicase PcrA, partial [Chlorobium sp.]
ASGSASSRGFQSRSVAPQTGFQAPRQEKKPAANGLRAGSLVHHAMFGPGMVLELQGSGSTAKVKIRFRSAGDKTLMVQYANLKIVG